MEFNRVSHALRTILGMNKKFPGYRELFLEGCVKGEAGSKSQETALKGKSCFKKPGSGLKSVEPTLKGRVRFL